MKLIEVRSPGFRDDFGNWQIWRNAMAADDAYIRANLQRLPGELIKDYERRRGTTPVPAFIKATIREVITGIYSQMQLTSRSRGPQSFQEAVPGGEFGVDGSGTSLNYFLIMEVLKELLVMRRVGIFVDRPVLSEQPTLKEAANAPPYMYMFKAEQILAWHVKPGNITPDEVLLRRDAPLYYEDTLITVDVENEYVYLRKSGPETVQCDIFDHDGDLVKSLQLNLPAVPFVLLETSESIIQDVIGHQNALLNLGSSNVAFAIAANLAVYTEQTDMGWLMQALRQKQDQEAGEDDAENPNTDVGVIEIGLNKGRRYMQNAQPPSFISPDNINLERAAYLYEQLRDDIRRIILLAIQNVSVRGLTTATGLLQSQAATSNGLAALAIILEKAERQLVAIWSAYEATPYDYTVKYPADFQVMSKAERFTLINDLAKLRELVPAKDYQLHITKSIAALVVGPEAAPGQLAAINQQIDEAPGVISSPETITSLTEAGILPREYAAQLLNLPDDAAVKANLEHAERLQRIAASQMSAAGAARGNTDGAGNAVDEKTLSQSADLSDTGGKQVRG